MTTGPVVSQFMLLGFLIDDTVVIPEADPLTPFTDYRTAFQPGLDVQVGMKFIFVLLLGQTLVVDVSLVNYGLCSKFSHSRARP